MKSALWTQSPEEARRDAHDRLQREQFIREASLFSTAMFELIVAPEHRFSRDDESKEKAVWMLHVDAVDSLRDCLSLLEQRRHRVAGRLFRDVVETLDLASYFRSLPHGTLGDLRKWYGDDVIPHRRYRDHLKKLVGPVAADAKAVQYAQLSKLTHRTYGSLLQGYGLGEADALVYEGEGSGGSLIPMQSVAEYFAVLGGLMLYAYLSLLTNNVVSQDEALTAWRAAFGDADGRG